MSGPQNHNELNALSEELLLKVKMNEESRELQVKLKLLNFELLHTCLNSEQNKKAFWINIYNAFYQIMRKEGELKTPKIYSLRTIDIAGIKFSLDDIEHGILRKGQYKYALGFIRNLFVPQHIKKLMVERLDYRIHFALNCGAKSCPPIAFYKAQNLDEQLDMASQTFLEQETDYDPAEQIVYTTALFKWFYADFGRSDGIKRIYKKQLGKHLSNYTIKYKAYSWEDDLENFVN